MDENPVGSQRRHAGRLRRGYNVEALPNPGTGVAYDGREGFKDAKLQGKRDGVPGTELTKADLLERLKAMPEGARAGVLWLHPGQKGKVLTGHTIACEKVNGKLLFSDPQNGRIGDAALGKAHQWYGYFYYRMDNCALRGDFEWEKIVKEKHKD